MGKKKTVATISIQPRSYKTKMDSEEVQEYLKLKRGNGSHKSPKDYTRKPKYKEKFI